VTNAACVQLDVFPPSRPGSLLERAILRLSRGPATTAELAGEILALRGNPSAAASAVFALLGTDTRVTVSKEGVWTLAHSAPAPETPATALRLMDWVVVDVETTGGSPALGGRIIEFAAVHIRNGVVDGSYATLVNPVTTIPRMITSITGIANEMVESAPLWEDIAPRVSDELRGKIFVGHNASFDWRFVSAEMERCYGRGLLGRQLCTLRLAKRILPHLRSRSLGSLADYYGIGMDQHHRALDDALATARLLLRFFETLEEQGVVSWSDLERYFQPRREGRRKRSLLPRSMDAA
jgi:DNA polymerase-3 subunit epsilon